MSDTERTFIRQLKITLIAILGPFILASAGSAFNDHYKIKNNQDHIRILESTMVDYQLMVLYVDELRRLNTAVKEDVENHCAETDAQITIVNNRIDILVREIYKHSARGIPKEVNQ